MNEMFAKILIVTKVELKKNTSWSGGISFSAV